MILVVGGQKGGVGKSTLAINISVSLANKNKTILVDADNQKSIYNFYEKQQLKKNKLDFITEYGDLRKIIGFLNSKYDNIVVDTAGRDCLELRSATSIADIFLLPFGTSEADIFTANYICNTVLPKLYKVNNKIKTLAVFNKVPTHYLNNELNYAENYLTKFKKLKLLKSHAKYRKVYSDSYKLGISVFENTNQKAKSEITNITREIKNG